MKTKLPIIVIIACIVLTVAHFIFAEAYDLGFGISTTVSILIIIAMLLQLKNEKNN